MAAAATTAAALLLQATINHVVLPPRLPSRADRNIEAIEISLLDRLIQAVRQIVAQQVSSIHLPRASTFFTAQASSHLHACILTIFLARKESLGRLGNSATLSSSLQAYTYGWEAV